VSAVQYYARGVDFPAEKEEVAQAAESNGAPQDMVAQIRGAAADRFGASRRSCKRYKAASTVAKRG
jgi:hypothetical protein